MGIQDGKNNLKNMSDTVPSSRLPSKIKLHKEKKFQNIYTKNMDFFFFFFWERESIMVITPNWNVAQK